MGILPDIRVGDGIRPDLGRPEQNFIPYGSQQKIELLGNPPAVIYLFWRVAVCVEEALRQRQTFVVPRIPREPHVEPQYRNLPASAADQ